jgi:hypothetical protein
MKFLVPFLVAFVVCPAFIVLHELAHLGAGDWLGFDGQLHYAKVTGVIPQDKLTPQADLLHTGAGPLAQALLTVGGFVGLYWLRRNRRTSPATLLDWLATVLILNAGRWVWGLAGPPRCIDERQISQILGMPAWLIPDILGLLAVIPLVIAVRLHPPGSRLLPFTALILGASAATVVWFRLLGPLLLP